MGREGGWEKAIYATQGRCGALFPPHHSTDLSHLCSVSCTDTDRGHTGTAVKQRAFCQGRGNAKLCENLFCLGKVTLKPGPPEPQVGRRVVILVEVTTDGLQNTTRISLELPVMCNRSFSLERWHMLIPGALWCALYLLIIYEIWLKFPVTVGCNRCVVWKAASVLGDSVHGRRIPSKTNAKQWKECWHPRSDFYHVVQSLTTRAVLFISADRNAKLFFGTLSL